MGVLQKLHKENDSLIEKAEMYYGILSVVNNLKLTEREIQLVAFTAIKGNISNANVKTEFCRTKGTSFPTINNIISKMKRLNILLKEKGKIKVNPLINLDFNQEIVLHISI